MKITRKRILYLAVGLVVAALVVHALKPKPVAVDLAQATRGPMRLTIDEDGETRIKERYMIYAPIGGRLQRISLDSGDPVTADQTILATIEPRDPALLDPRDRAELEARVSAARATVEQTRAQSLKANSDADLAQGELDRAAKLVKTGAISRQEFDDKSHRADAAREAARSAESAVRVAEFQLKQAEAAYTRSAPGATEGSPNWSFPIPSPITGTVLRVLQESAKVVQPGDQLLEIGNPGDLEIWIDVLTTDAVKARPGDEVVIEHWGGETPLEARVRRIEPAGFTKISALGVEEKRTWIVADLTDDREKWSALGDNYRIEARIVIWQANDVLKIPSGALFRHRDGWAVFRVIAGKAELHPIKIGHDNGLEAEVLDGLSPGDLIIVHPSDQITNGLNVTVR